MKPVAATLVASLGFLTSGCSVEQTPAALAQGSITTVPVTVLQFADATGTGDARAGDAPTRAEKTSAADNGVRDAKEATEEAARRIADATLNAANRIREAGASALQVLRDPEPEVEAVVEAEAVPHEAVRDDHAGGG